MNIVVYTSRGAKFRNIHIGNVWQKVCAGLSLVAVLSVFVLMGYWAGSYRDPEAYIVDWQQDLSQQRKALEQVRTVAESNINAFAAQLGRVQGHVTRLDALGERLVAMAKIDAGEFDFVQDLALGGPDDIEVSNQQSGNLDTLERAIADLDGELAKRESQLLVLEDAIANHNLKAEVYPRGRPVGKGWLSSNFGWRTNPFGGNREFHRGVDFAGQEGSQVFAVAGGVVTWSGRRYGYGNLVEINHGNGYVTRYGHNKANVVKEGEAVKKGQLIASMGSTGRSTGPHVHFEVIKDGKKINPLSFIQDH